MVSLSSLKISLPRIATVLIFFTAGLLSLVLRARRLLGAYRIPWRPAFSSHLVSPNCVFDASLVPETCPEFSAFAILIRDSIRQAKADIRHGASCPTVSMAPVLAITSLVARTLLCGPLTPLESFLNRSSPGRTGSSFSTEEDRDEDRQNAVAKSQVEEG